MVVPAELITALNGTTVADSDVRKNAEAFLANCQLKEGFLESLLTVIADASVDIGVREIAAIVLKNEIRVRWTDWESADLPTQIENQSKSSYDLKTKATIRENLLKVYLAIPLANQHLRRQVEEAVNQLISHDYPNWEAVNPAVVACLSQTDDIQALISGLTILRKVCGRYELTTQDAQAKEKLEPFMTQVGPLMLSIVAKMKDNLFATPEAAFIVKLVAKIYWSMTTVFVTTSQYLSSSQADWMQFIDLVLTTPIPESLLPLAAQDIETIDACPAMKSKKWILHTLRRFFTGFSTSRTITNGSNQSEFANSFAQKWGIHFLNRLLDMEVAYVAAQSSGLHMRIVTPKLHSIVIEYFMRALETSEAYKTMKPRIEFLVTEVIHPALSYTAKDVHDFLEDPVQYAWNSTSTFNAWIPSSTSVRPAASEFIRALPRFRGKDFLEPVATFCIKQMDAYNATPPEQRGMGSPASRAKDGALVMLGEFAARLCSKKRSVSVETIIYTYILPHLECHDDLLLTLRSCWATGRLINPSHSFIAPGEGKIENSDKFLYTFRKLLECCGHDNLAIRVHAIGALASFIVMSVPALDEYVKAVMINIIDVILATLEKVSIESIMTTLNYLVQRYPDDIIPHTTKLMKYLVQCALTVIKEDEDGAGGDGDGDGDGSPFSYLSANAEDNVESAFATFSICKTINTVLEIISDPKHAKLFESITPELLPFLDTMMTPENEDFLEDALQALAYATFYPPTFDHRLWRYYERIYQAVCGGSTPHLPLETAGEGFAADAVRYMVPCLDNYLNQGTETFLTGRCDALNLSYKEMYMLIVKASFNGDFDPDAPAFAYQLLWILVDNFADSIDKIQDLIQPAMQMAWEYMLKPKQPISKSMKEEMSKFLLTLLYVKPKDFLTLCGSMGVMDETLKLTLDPSHLKTYEAKKIWLLAIINLLRAGQTDPTILPPIVASNPKALLLTISKITLDVITWKQSDDDEESEWGSVDSEQDLDENEDAQPSTFSSNLLECLANTKDGDDKDEDDEYELDTSEILGDRLSPLDAIPELAVVQNFMAECKDSFLEVLGPADHTQLLTKIEEELQRQEKPLITPAAA